MGRAIPLISHGPRRIETLEKIPRRTTHRRTHNHPRHDGRMPRELLASRIGLPAHGRETDLVTLHYPDGVRATLP